MEDVNLLLSYIETEIMDGKKPFMGSGVTVDGEAILNLVKRVRLAVNAINGEDVLAEANERAKKIVALAEQRKAQLLEDSIIIAEAKAIAEHTVDEALKRKSQVEEQLKNNVVKMLMSVKGTLNEAEKSVDETAAMFRPERN